MRVADGELIESVFNMLISGPIEEKRNDEVIGLRCRKCRTHRI